MIKLSIKPHKPIILASASKIRSKILKNTGIEFTIKNPSIDEENIKKKIAKKTVSNQAKILASAKALKISENNPNTYVIGADQICSINKMIFKKPLNIDNAINQLKRLSGKTHKQTSAISLFYEGKKLWCHTEEALLTMYKLSENEIKNYLNIDKPFQSCGSYKFESYGHHLFSKVIGDSYTIQGFPLISLLRQLRKYKLYSLKNN
tara:strand:- start:2242 stop:2859 length:618 start_codon:yes stop_codon:yes gene_type:complete